MKKAISGAIGGFLATLPMTAVMSNLHRRLPAAERYPLPPRLIMEQFVPEHQGEAARCRWTQLGHYGYGALSGALYPAYVTTVGSTSLIHDALFGVLVWAGSYLGWIPAFGVLPPVTRSSARRNTLMISAHIVWGVGTGVTARALEPACATLPPHHRQEPYEPVSHLGVAGAIAGLAGGLLFILALDRMRWHRAPFTRSEPPFGRQGRMSKPPP